VVLHAAHVGEAQVDEFDLVVLDEFLDGFERHGAASADGRMPGTMQAPCQPRRSGKRLIYKGSSKQAMIVCTNPVRIANALHQT
jgi:hypothetical protein